MFAGGAGIAMLVGLVVVHEPHHLGRGAERGQPVARSRRRSSDINDRRFYSLAFGLGGALAGGAGAVVAPIYSLSPAMGLMPDTQAFAIVILGGLGSVAGSILAGLMIGVSEAMFVALFPDPSRSLTYAQAFSLLILILVLLFRPTGFFGRRPDRDGIDRCAPSQSAAPSCIGALVLAFPHLVNAYWLTVGDPRPVLRHRRRELGAAGRLCRAVLVRPHGVRVDRRLHLRAAGEVVRHPVPLGMAGGVVLSFVVGAGIGYIGLRMRGPYLALFTVAFSEVLRIIIVSENEVTGGSGGMEVPPLFHTPLRRAVLLSRAGAAGGIVRGHAWRWCRRAGACSSAPSARTRRRRRRPV